jgi:26S proteasome regulatory subunit N12
VKDGRIWFEGTTAEAAAAAERDVLSASGQVIENTLGYARELETIV